MLRTLYRLYKFLNILSVDVALGSVCCAIFFARLFQVSILSFGMISLGLTVWIIYSVDHLLDALRIKGEASTTRHQFHQQYFRPIMMLVILASLINAILIFFIRKPVFWSGVILVVCVGLYLVIHRVLKFPKEIFISILYTLGVILPSSSVTAVDFEQWPWVIIIQFALTALSNLLIFSWFDLARDVRDGNRSFATLMTESRTKIVVWCILSMNALLGIIFFDGFSTAVLLSMNLVLAGIFVFDKHFSKSERFRILGDAIFFIPIFYLLL